MISYRSSLGVPLGLCLRFFGCFYVSFDFDFYAWTLPIAHWQISRCKFLLVLVAVITQRPKLSFRHKKSHINNNGDYIKETERERQRTKREKCSNWCCEREWMYAASFKRTTTIILFVVAKSLFEMRLQCPSVFSLYGVCLCARQFLPVVWEMSCIEIYWFLLQRLRRRRHRRRLLPAATTLYHKRRT